MAGERGRHGARRIMAYRLIAECRLVFRHTLQFPLAEIDPDGILVLDQRTATINKTSLAWDHRREAAKPKIELCLAEETTNLAS